MTLPSRPIDGGLELGGRADRGRRGDVGRARVDRRDVERQRQPSRCQSSSSSQRPSRRRGEWRCGAPCGRSCRPRCRRARVLMTFFSCATDLVDLRLRRSARSCCRIDRGELRDGRAAAPRCSRRRRPCQNRYLRPSRSRPRRCRAAWTGSPIAARILPASRLLAEAPLGSAGPSSTTGASAGRSYHLPSIWSHVLPPPVRISALIGVLPECDADIRRRRSCRRNRRRRRA